MRDEVDKQIRHLQRQAAAARRYQALKEQERRADWRSCWRCGCATWTAARRCTTAAVRERELAMQAALADQRAARRRSRSSAPSTPSTASSCRRVQGRYYEVGAEITRTGAVDRSTRASCASASAAIWPRRATTLAELAAHIDRDEQQVAALRAELAQPEPRSCEARSAEAGAAAALRRERAASWQDWQQRWETVHTRALGAAEQSAQVERARIEQLENQLRRLARARRAPGRRARGRSAPAHPGAQLAQLAEQEAQARAAQRGTRRHAERARTSACRRCVPQQPPPSSSSRTRAPSARRRARELMSLEAVQKAALSDHAGRDAGEWLTAVGLAARPRVAPAAGGRATAGSARSRPCSVTTSRRSASSELEDVAARCEHLTAGRITLVERQRRRRRRAGGRYAGRARARAGRAASRSCRRVLHRRTPWREALRARAALRAGAVADHPRRASGSGASWLRVSRGTDQHAGVLEREQRLKALRADCRRGRRSSVQQAEAGL